MISCPYRAKCVCIILPRAMPWANIFCPFRAESNNLKGFDILTLKGFDKLTLKGLDKLTLKGFDILTLKGFDILTLKGFDKLAQGIALGKMTPTPLAPQGREIRSPGIALYRLYVLYVKKKPKKNGSINCKKLPPHCV
jgi:hypothetical protein